jgi:hypothetical protein
MKKTKKQVVRVGTKDNSVYERVLGADGLWRITKHSDSYLNAQRLAEINTRCIIK